MSSAERIKEQITTFKISTESVIDVILNFRFSATGNDLKYRTMEYACYLFKRNVLDPWSQSIETKNKLLSAFVSLFAYKHLNHFIDDNDPEHSKYQSLFSGEIPIKYAPRLYGMKILEDFTNRVSIFEDIVKYWDETTE